MTLEAIYYVGQTVAVIAILASLVFVGLQVRQNTKYTRAQTQRARVDRLVTQMVGFSDADKCAAYIRGNGGDPTPEAIMDRQFYMQCITQLAIISDVFTQHRDGLLNDEQLALVSETYRAWLREPGFKAHWDGLKSLASNQTEVTAFIDGLVPKDDTSPSTT